MMIPILSRSGCKLRTPIIWRSYSVAYSVSPISSSLLQRSESHDLHSTTFPTSASQSRTAYTVRVIVIDQDLPNGQAYAGDVVHVSAGYARNYLLPQRKVVYATRANFDKLNMKDPDQETTEERRLRLERQAKEGADKDLKAADVLKSYLRNKTVCVYCIASLEIV